MSAAKPFRWVVEFHVDPLWVADGFDMTDERAHEMIQREISWCYGHEVSAKVLEKPSANRIARMQGYKSVADRKARGHE